MASELFLWSKFSMYHYECADHRKVVRVSAVAVSAIAVSVFADLLPPKGSSVTAPKASGADLLKEPFPQIAAFYSA